VIRGVCDHPTVRFGAEASDWENEGGDGSETGDVARCRREGAASSPVDGGGDARFFFSGDLTATRRRCWGWHYGVTRRGGRGWIRRSERS
jgi:hypothetical protein